MATVQQRNGVNLDQLVETINAIKADPSLAKFQFRSTSEWESGARCKTTIESFYGAGTEHEHQRTHVMEGDEPPVLLGSDTAPNAVETVLGGLASCLAVGFAYNAAAQGIELEDVRFSVEGDLDLHAFLGLRDDVRPGYESIRVTCDVKSPASRNHLEELKDYVIRTSPVFDIVANRVPVSVELAN